MSTKAILFDLDETLMVEYASDEKALRETCHHATKLAQVDAAQLFESVRQHGQACWETCPEQEYTQTIGISYVEGLWGDFIGEDPDLKALHDWIPSYRADVWKQALADQFIQDEGLGSELQARFQRERRSRHHLYDDAMPVLRELVENYRLALVTNGSPDVQGEKIIRSNLSTFFDSIVISGKVGLGKPDPEPFQQALAQLYVSAASAVMVGDSIEHDIMGAREVGIRTVWINRHKRKHKNGHLADAVIFSLTELKDHL